MHYRAVYLLQRNVWKCGQIRRKVRICPHFHTFLCTTHFYAVPHTSIQYYTLLYSTIHPYTILHARIQYYTLLCSTVHPIQYYTPLCSTTHSYTLLYTPIRCYTLSCSTAHPYTVLHTSMQYCTPHTGTPGMLKHWQFHLIGH